MDTETLKQTIRRELPALLRDDPALRDYILQLTRQEYAGREETHDRFYQILAELRRDREEQARKWDEQNRKWEAQALKWDEQDRKWEAGQQELKALREEQARRWEEHDRKWEAGQQELKALREEQARRWEEHDRKWEAGQQELRVLREEHNRKWDAQQQEIRALNEALAAQVSRHDRSIGALGSRWGMQSEAAFRNALAGILEKSFGVEVINVNEYDDQGEVFGRPEQIELDVIVKNGLLLICELKSSIDKAGMYGFERKARFYEKRHNRKADRLIVISPMVDPKAEKVAHQLGIELFSDSVDVKSL